MSATATEQASAFSPAVVPAVAAPSTDVTLLSVAAVAHGTTYTLPGGTDEEEQVTGGTAVGDFTLVVGSQNVAGALGDPTPTVSITDTNPNAHSTTSLRSIVAAIPMLSEPPSETFTDGFDTDTFDNWRTPEIAAEDDAVILTDTPPTGETAYVRLTADNADVFPLTPTANPRAQLSTQRILYEGVERYVSFWVRLPETYPAIPYAPAGWCTLFQWYGPPYPGVPPFFLGTTGEWFQVLLNDNNGYARPWRAPIIRGEWVKFDLRAYFTGGSGGWFDLWMNGERQRFTDGSYRFRGPTIDPENADPIEAKICVYRLVDCVAGEVSADFAGVRIDPDPPAGLDLAIPPARIALPA